MYFRYVVISGAYGHKDLLDSKWAQTSYFLRKMATSSKLAEREDHNDYNDKGLDRHFTFFRFMLLGYFCNKAFKEGILAEPVTLQF